MQQTPTSEIRIDGEGVVVKAGLLARHDACFLVVANAFFKEVGLALQRDHFHPWEGVGGLERLVATEANQQPVSHKLRQTTHGQIERSK